LLFFLLGLRVSVAIATAGNGVGTSSGTGTVSGRTGTANNGTGTVNGGTGTASSTTGTARGEAGTESGEQPGTANGTANGTGTASTDWLGGSLLVDDTGAADWLGKSGFTSANSNLPKLLTLSSSSKQLHAQLPVAIKAKKSNAKNFGAGMKKMKSRSKTSKVKKLPGSKGLLTDHSLFSHDDSNQILSSSYINDAQIEEITSIPHEIMLDNKNNGEFSSLNQSNNEKRQNQVIDDLTIQLIHYGATFAEWVQDEVDGVIRPQRRRLNTSTEYMNVDNRNESENDDDYL
jgi:hypothetical protein